MRACAIARLVSQLVTAGAHYFHPERCQQVTERNRGLLTCHQANKGAGQSDQQGVKFTECPDLPAGHFCTTLMSLMTGGHN